MTDKKRGPGRPPMAKGKAKVGVFTLRLSEEERAAIERAATRSGKSVSEWARNALIAATGEP